MKITITILLVPILWILYTGIAWVLITLFNMTFYTDYTINIIAGGGLLLMITSLLQISSNIYNM